MKVYIFQGSGNYYGFTTKDDASDLDPSKGPWSLFKTQDMNRGEPPRIGISTDEVLDVLESGKSYIPPEKQT